jgi:hypothetical protein
MIFTTHMLTQTSSMFHPDVSGPGQSSAWQWQVRIGRRPDGTCGASPALEEGDEMPTKRVLMYCPIYILYGIFF